MPNSDGKPYYNHDQDWQSRADQGNPRWGGQSEKVYDRFVARIREFVGAGARVLDGGCGAGAFGLRLIGLGYEYFGVDESAVGVALGLKFHENSANYHLRHLDLAQASCPEEWSNHFDIVTSINVLHCLSETIHRSHYLAFLFQALRPGGLVIFSTMCGPPAPGFRPSNRPRTYAPPAQIALEFANVGFLPAIRWDLEPTHDRSLIPNLMGVCHKPML